MIAIELECAQSRAGYRGIMAILKVMSAYYGARVWIKH
jgi:hypothetical protein